MILLILQDDKMIFDSSNPKLQVVAEAIVAYQYNNNKHDHRGMPTLDKIIFPCITIVGTCPTFYLVPVTWALSNAVIIEQHLTMSIEVWKYMMVIRKIQNLLKHA